MINVLLYFKYLYLTRVGILSLIFSDVDECASGFNGGCEDVCVDRIPDLDNVTHECACSESGFEVDPSNNFLCVDIDECAHPDLHDCDGALNGSNPDVAVFDPSNSSAQAEVQAECVNIPGSFECACPHPDMYPLSMPVYKFDTNTSTCMGE